jgi:CO/xanthine dehydrogenase FAD-binding subunit
LRENDFAIMIAGTVLTLDSGGICSEARIGIAPAGPTPIRATTAEDYLPGKKLDDDAIYAAGERAVEGVNPREDINGSRDYKLHLIKVLTRRSLKLALSRIKQD